MNSQNDLRSRRSINRHSFVSIVAAGAASTLIQGVAAQPKKPHRSIGSRPDPCRPLAADDR
jgi:hypothetical protein